MTQEHRPIVINGTELVNGLFLGALKPVYAIVANVFDNRVPETNIPRVGDLVTRAAVAAPVLGILTWIDSELLDDGLWVLGGSSLAEVVLILSGLLNFNSKK